MLPTKHSPGLAAALDGRTKAPNSVYTRKSTEEGLDQEFNSLDAQRDSGESYIRSQAHEGWECLPDHYDDGGFTGGNMDRPALKRLMADTQGSANASTTRRKAFRLDGRRCFLSST